MATNTAGSASCDLLYYFPTRLNISIQELSLSHSWFAAQAVFLNEPAGRKEKFGPAGQSQFPSAPSGNPFRASGGPRHEAANVPVQREPQQPGLFLSERRAEAGKGERPVWRALAAGVPGLGMAAGEEALEGLDGATLEELMERSFVDEPGAERW